MRIGSFFVPTLWGWRAGCFRNAIRMGDNAKLRCVEAQNRPNHPTFTPKITLFTPAGCCHNRLSIPYNGVSNVIPFDKS